MRVYDLIETLKGYDKFAEVSVVVNNNIHSFSICYGHSDGCTKERCEEVLFCIDAPNSNSENEG